MVVKVISDFVFSNINEDASDGNFGRLIFGQFESMEGDVEFT